MTNLTFNVDKHLNVGDATAVDSKAAVESLVHAYYDDVLHLATTILKDTNEAADVTQEVFIKAVTHLDGYRGEAAPKTWLFSIAINQCRQALRKRKSSQKLTKTLQRLSQFVKRTRSPEEKVSDLEQDTELWTAVAQLKEKHRLPILLHYVHNLSTREIAEVLDSRPGTIQSRLHYGRRELHHKLQQAPLTHLNRRPNDK